MGREYSTDDVLELVEAVFEYRNTHQNKYCPHPDCGICKRSKKAAFRLDRALLPFKVEIPYG